MEQSFDNINDALMEAVSDFNVEAVRSFLEQGANANYYRPVNIETSDESNQPNTPLRMVVFRISDSMLEDEDLKKFGLIAALLIQYGADPHVAIPLAESRYGKYDPQHHEEGDYFLDVYKIIVDAMK